MIDADEGVRPLANCHQRGQSMKFKNRIEGETVEEICLVAGCGSNRVLSGLNIQH